jgi:lactonase
LLICTNDIENGSEGGSMIYTVEAFAKEVDSEGFYGVLDDVAYFFITY